MNGKDWTVKDHVRGEPPGCRDLYERIVELVEACGPQNRRDSALWHGFAAPTDERRWSWRTQPRPS